MPQSLTPRGDPRSARYHFHPARQHMHPTTRSCPPAMRTRRPRARDPPATRGGSPSELKQSNPFSIHADTMQTDQGSVVQALDNVAVTAATALAGKRSFAALRMTSVQSDPSLRLG